MAEGDIEKKKADKETEEIEESEAADLEEPETEKEGHDEANEEKHTIASRGVPSSESLYLPSYTSPEIRSFQDSNESETRNLWSLEEVLNFVFPRKYQAKYYEAALGFMKLVIERTRLSGAEINSFVHSSGVSKATFYNRVLPRLKRVGFIKVERETIVAVESKRKFRPMTILISKTFGNYLNKIGNSWLAIVDDARYAKKKEEK